MKKKLLRFVTDKEGDTGYIKVRLNKKVSDLYVKKIALAEIW